jgi:hypothetical protein
MNRIYLDDVRTPLDDSWIVVRNYDQFVEKVKELGLHNIDLISLDHDLGPSAMREYFHNVHPNYQLDYNNITEKTGMDCAKWLVQHFYDTTHDQSSLIGGTPINFPRIYVHSANPIGSGNIMGYINNFLMNEGQRQTCIRVEIEHN